MGEGHEADKNIEIWRVKKLIKALDAARGNGTSMISLIMPPRDQISRVTKMLGDEYGTASNIKSRVNRQSVLAAITSAQQRLKLYSRVPPNGLVLYTGTIVTDDGKEKKVTFDFEPFRPINASLYLCDNKFHTEALNELLASDDKFGFIVMDGNGTLYGTLSGNSREVLYKFSVDLPKKHGRGGQSAVRFARLRMERRHNYLRKVAELATQYFINPATNQPNIVGLILAGSADFKNELGKSEMFDPRLQAKVVKMIDVSYGGDSGFNQAIEMSAEVLSDVKFVQEKKLIGKYFEEISQAIEKMEPLEPPDPPLSLGDGVGASPAPPSISHVSSSPSNPSPDPSSPFLDLPSDGCSSGNSDPNPSVASPAPSATTGPLGVHGGLAGAARCLSLPATTDSAATSAARGVEGGLLGWSMAAAVRPTPSLPPTISSAPLSLAGPALVGSGAVPSRTCATAIGSPDAGDVPPVDEVIVEDGDGPAGISAARPSSLSPQAAPFHPRGSSGEGRSKARRWADAAGCSDDESAPAASRPSYLDVARKSLRDTPKPLARAVGAAQCSPVVDGACRMASKGRRRQRQRQRRRSCVPPPPQPARVVPVHRRLGSQQSARISVLQRLGPRQRPGTDVDADGFRTVVTRRLRRCPGRAAPKRRRPVPPELVGRCFNCLARDHVAAQCCSPSRCFRCLGNGHRAGACKLGRSPPNRHGLPSPRLAQRLTASSPSLQQQRGLSVSPPVDEVEDRSRSLSVSPPVDDVVDRPRLEAFVVRRGVTLATSGVEYSLVLVALTGGRQQAATPEDFLAHLSLKFNVLVGVTGGCVGMEGDLSCNALQDGEMQPQAGLHESEPAVDISPCREFDPMEVEVEASQAVSEVAPMLDMSLSGPDGDSSGTSPMPLELEDVVPRAPDAEDFGGTTVLPVADPVADGVVPSRVDALNAVQAELEAAVCIPMRSPLIHAGPRLRRSRTPVSSSSLRRSGRIAARPRALNATVQAQLVLLKKLGIGVADNASDSDVEKKIKLAFRGDMSSRKREALQIFLGGGIDLSAMDLNLQGLEDAPL